MHTIQQLEPAAYILAALAVAALVGFLFRQQLEDLSSRIRDAKKYRDDDIDTLYGHAAVNRDNIQILNNRLNAIEENLQSPPIERPLPSDYGYDEEQDRWEDLRKKSEFYKAMERYELATAGRTTPYGLEEKVQSLQKRVDDIEEKGTILITIGSIPITADIPANVDAAEVTKKVSENVMELIQKVKVIGSESSTKG